jgi:hypothetical protein
VPRLGHEMRSSSSVSWANVTPRIAGRMEPEITTASTKTLSQGILRVNWELVS